MLVEARELVEKHFTWSALARTAEGQVCSPRDPRADCFCAIGALCHVAGARGYMDLMDRRAIHGDAGRQAMVLLDAAAERFLPGRRRFAKSPADVNDEIGQAGVLGMYDTAIAWAGPE